MRNEGQEAPTEGSWLAEVTGGERFRFGRNWRAFLRFVDERVITEAEHSLAEMLGPGSVAGRSFLDVGSGSGLFSLAAARLGAREVRSFDFDAESVACTRALRERFASTARWTIGPGSILDRNFTAGLGNWDIVYSWGVLHHTGAMLAAFEEVSRLVAPGGILFVAIYNDQGAASRRWRSVKRLFVSGAAGRIAVSSILIPAFLAVGLLKDVLRARNPMQRFDDYRRQRGMSLLHDWLDWLGGYPFEVARPEEVFGFFRARGFEMRRLKTCGAGHGCNEFVFVKDERDPAERSPGPAK